MYDKLTCNIDVSSWCQLTKYNRSLAVRNELRFGLEMLVTFLLSTWIYEVGYMYRLFPSLTKM